MTEGEIIVRKLLVGRACVCGVAADADTAYRILGADLEAAMRELFAEATHDAVREYRSG